MKQYSIKEQHQLLLEKKIKPSDLVKNAFEQLKKFQYLNATVTELELEAQELAKQMDQLTVEDDNFLFAIPYFAKDNFATKGINTTASSKILANFIPTYESTVTKRLAIVKSILLGKSALDELGMGGHGLYALTGEVVNPWDQTRITGGSSSGSAALVSAGVVSYALGTDTGDSVRKPAGYCGIVGVKPTYGLISRFGVIPYAPSLDTIGVFTRTVEDSAIVLDALISEDHLDATSLQSREQNYFQNLKGNIQGIKFAYFKGVHQQLDPTINLHFIKLFQQLQNKGYEVSGIDFPEELLKALLPVYMIISFAEAVSSHSCLDGINYGLRVAGDSFENVMINSRVNGFGHVVKRRYVIGSYALTKENQTLLFLKAKKIRRLIVDALSTIFMKFDILLLPANSTVAPKIKDIKDHVLTEQDLNHYVDDLLVLANLMGNPSLTLPVGLTESLPIGINVNAKPFNDQLMLNASYLIEELIGLKNLVASEVGVK